MGQADRWELTANQYLAAPMISRADGSVHSLNVLLRTALGLIEWTADHAAERPLLAPQIRVDGKDVMLSDLSWERLERWIPRFRLRAADQLTIAGTFCAPAGYEASRRGAFYHFEIENHGTREQQVEIALLGDWVWSLQTVQARRPLAAERRIARSATREGLALELSGIVQCALGIAVYGADAQHSIIDGPAIAPGEQRVAANGQSILFKVGRTVRLAAGRRAAITFFIGIGAEREGALATATALRRVGAERLLKETRLELSRIARKTPDSVLGAILNRNLLFSYFFGLARAIDDERLYPVTTRSPLHPRCATFNERDALLWALPAVILADPPLARELVLRCFEQYSHRPGEAVRYVDGGVLEPGFALHQWAAYVLAVQAYIDGTGDGTLADEPLVIEVLRELETGIYLRLHPEVFLASTELLPSGEVADHPYVTFDNVLLWSALRALSSLRAADSEEAKRSATAADEVASAIWRRCTTDVDGLPVLAWSTDLRESASVYDDPAGSLMLLPHYHFCDSAEPLWRNTVEFLRSPRYRLWLGDRAFPGLAGRSAPSSASTAALCADLLGFRSAETLALIRKLEWYGGVASTHYDPDTGASRGAVHDAAVAGFLAWSLHNALKA